MRPTFKTVSLVLTFGFAVCGLGQTALTTQPGPLELRLQPESYRKNIPQAFTVLIVNKSDHDMHLPLPADSCGDVPHGTVRLNLHFEPFGPGTSGLVSGCIKDFGYQPILERVKGWRILHPGESLTLMTYSLLAQDAGSYDYSASYDPPGMPKADEEVLQQAGIDYPKSRLESAHIRFRRK